MIAFPEPPPNEPPQSPALRNAYRLVASTFLPSDRNSRGGWLRRGLAWLIAGSLIGLIGWGIYRLVLAATS